MLQWHERLPARLGLRLAGLALLGGAWTAGSWLQHMVIADPSAEPSIMQALLAALMFVCASAGMLLAVVGAGLWKPVGLSDRWATRMPVPPLRDRKPALHMMTATQGDNIHPQNREAPYVGERSPIRHSDLPFAGCR